MQNTTRHWKFVLAISCLAIAVFLFVIFFFAETMGNGSQHILGLFVIPFLIISYVFFSIARHEEGSVGYVSGVIKKIMQVIFDIFITLVLVRLADLHCGVFSHQKNRDVFLEKLH